MRTKYDEQVDVLYIALNNNKPHKTQQIHDALVLDFDEHGVPCGIELISASKFVDDVHTVEQYIYPTAFADMVDADVNTIYRILRNDESLPPERRRIPGAVKHGSGQRVFWQIPKTAVDSFTKSKRGRKKQKV